MNLPNKPVAWIKSEIKTRPIFREAREEIGRLIRRSQRGLSVTMSHSRPMPEIGKHCHHSDCGGSGFSETVASNPATIVFGN